MSQQAPIGKYKQPQASVPMKRKAINDSEEQPAAKKSKPAAEEEQVINGTVAIQDQAAVNAEQVELQQYQEILFSAMGAQGSIDLKALTKKFLDAQLYLLLNKDYCLGSPMLGTRDYRDKGPAGLFQYVSVSFQLKKPLLALGFYSYRAKEAEENLTDINYQKMVGTSKINKIFHRSKFWYQVIMNIIDHLQKKNTAWEKVSWEDLKHLLEKLWTNDRMQKYKVTEPWWKTDKREPVTLFQTDNFEVECWKQVQDFFINKGGYRLFDHVEKPASEAFEVIQFDE